MADWQGQIVRMLINAGTIGCKQSDVQKRVSRYVEATQVNAYLNTLRMERKVQMFKVAIVNGTPATVWRATTRIVEN